MGEFEMPRWQLIVSSSVLALTLAACSGEVSQAPAPDTAQVEAEAPAAEIPAPALFTEAGLATADAMFAEVIANEHRSGIAAIFARHGEVAQTFEHGWSDVATQKPMTTDTVVRIASMTKPVTGVAIMQLIEDGTLSLDTPLSQFVPAFGEARVATSTDIDENMEIPTTELAQEITIEHLLTHTSGIGYVFDYETKLGALYLGNDIYPAEGVSVAERMDVLASMPLYFQPGDAYYYSYAMDVLGFVISEASGMSLEAYFQAEIFGPLGMTSTSFYTAGLESQDISTGYTHDETGALVAVEGSAEQATLLPWETGGAGLFSTANDYLKFAQMLANGGELNGVQILSPDSVEAMTTVHVDADRMPTQYYDQFNLGFGYTMGVTYGDGEGQTYRRPGDYGWSGYFDTGFVVSPSTGVVGVIMAQEVPGATTGETVGARAVFDAALYQALPDESGS